MSKRLAIAPLELECLANCMGHLPGALYWRQR